MHHASVPFFSDKPTSLVSRVCSLVCEALDLIANELLVVLSLSLQYISEDVSFIFSSLVAVSVLMASTEQGVDRIR